MQTPRYSRPSRILSYVARNKYERIMSLNDVSPEHVNRMFLWLKTLYNSRGRVYHNWAHIDEMLAMASNNIPNKINLAQYYAILFHDAIYTPGVRNNEAASVENLKLFIKCERQYGVWVSQHIVARACRIIMDTVHHYPTDSDSKLMIDLDLMRLSGNYEKFCDYSIMIEEEYGVIVGHEDFMIARLNFMKNFLARPRIFYTAFGKKNWEKPARENIKKYLIDNQGYIEHKKSFH